jgi:hypothetical protein
MRGTGIGTSLLLIATGAILAFAVDLRSTAVDINAIGAILIVVGLVGLLMSFMLMGEFEWMSTRHDHLIEHPDSLTPPHEHRRVETTDVVYEKDPSSTRVERERRIRR